MTQLNIALTAIGALVLVLGVVSNRLKRSFLSMPVLALAVGVILGPIGLGWLNLSDWGKPDTIIEQAARITLAIGLMGAALRLPRRFAQTHWRSLVVLLGLGMPLMWLASSALVYGVLDVSALLALLIGAAVCATDPVVASTIVTGSFAERNVPARLRYTLTAESGANDGLAYPFVLLPILLLSHSNGTNVWQEWIVRVVLREVLVAAIFGVVLGLAAGGLLRLAERYKAIQEHSFMSFTLALTLIALGGAKLLGTDGLLAVFLSGLALDRVVDTSDRHEEENVQEAVGQFFILPIFTLVGLHLPWQQWLELGWRGLALVLLVLLLRRLPFILLLQRLIPQYKARHESAFIGWFGPIGVAAVFYSMLSIRHLGDHTVWTITSLLVCSSIVVHGVTAAPLTRRLGRRYCE